MPTRSIALPTLAVLALAATTTLAATTQPTTRPRREPEAVFNRIDTDHDGLASKAEFEAFVAKTMERREGRAKGGKEARNGGPMAKGDAIFARLDVDKDGSLTPEEFAKFAESRREKGGKADRGDKARARKAKA